MIHALRVGLFVAILVLIRQKHATWLVQQTHLRLGNVTVERVRRFFPTARVVRRWSPQRDAQIVSDADGAALGYVIQTSPESDHIVGYLGPTNVLIAFDNQDQVLGIELLESADTREHVEDVASDQQFMHAYDGLDWMRAAQRLEVDGVTGATLTSLAIAEAISHRLGNPSPSLRFPQPLTIDELKSVLPRAAGLKPRPLQHHIHDVMDEHDRAIGAVLRTSPTSDAVIGYQGPTDALVVLDARQRVVRILVRSSYDNQPYVSYVGDDEYFCTLFNGRNLDELTSLDLEEAEVEGVSGATMTSMAVAKSLPRAAAAAVRQEPAPVLIVSPRDLGAVFVLTIGLVICFSHLRGRPRVRMLFRLTVVIYLGFVSGAMLSQALLVGWAQSGVPWRLAPGLTLLCGIALLVPAISKRQWYCHYVCPFGAAQQLIVGRRARRWSVSRRLRPLLSLIRPILLLLVVLTAILHLPINLASIEPFNAFVFWIAGAATVTIAAVGLSASTVVPMAYCRFGCPTGSVLDYLRYRGASDQFTRRDLLAIGLLVAAWVL